MNKKVQALLALILFISAVVFNNYIFTPRGYKLDKWEVIHGSEHEFVEAPFSEAIESTGIYYLETNFNKMDIDVLVLPHINGYAFNVYLNDNLIGGLGDFDNPTANIWNYTHLINIDKDLLKEENKLVLEVYSLHDIGFIITPSLDKIQNVYVQVQLQNFFSEGFIPFVVGIAFSISLLLFHFFFKSRKKEMNYLYTSIVCIFLCVYSLELTYRITTGGIKNFLIFRKIVVLSIFLSTYFTILSLKDRENVGHRIKKAIRIFVVFILFLGFAQKDFIEFYNYVTKLNYFVMILVIYMIILLFRNKDGRYFFTGIFYCLIALYTITGMIFSLPAVPLFYYGFFVYIINVALDLSVGYINIENDNIKLGELSKYDKLTGVYNRIFLERIPYFENDMLIFIDVDKFKRYNDTYGHQKGDELLKHIADVFVDKIQSSGKVIRYGGDEFVIYLQNENIHSATVIIEGIQREVKKLNEWIDISYGIAGYKDNIFDTLRIADTKMYKMKKLKKKRD